jgi:hypothetical protein
MEERLYRLFLVMSDCEWAMGFDVCQQLGGGRRGVWGEWHGTDGTVCRQTSSLGSPYILCFRFRFLHRKPERSHVTC